ncbi:MAG: heterodisulfide reductase subunit A [Nitrospirae bacterium CG_4_9_14_3_um_filter_53_35]|nr:MAG: heterodisulfide reductase subunit A [Nitrospirae bacterium CG2_30_53_67]PIW85539.1 MAG: heterodisulfide reductase subunit A [Nitrospirae bacterium CG_4_8_14_3_um_filter_50_41]PIX85644.1 MAG: heterodisulfide reductase subunit A [Nitrospirae bacterium CG_4_10_14_3_um_filter_53_41]PJA72902.1 MAG: heterodisulfide reductase subunit A [Nitrospirae bacterium CG_4_9_14_3_um_filter_53_35]
MEKKLGVYICTGCEIGSSLNIEAMNKVATQEHKAPVCRNHAAFCSDEGAQIIKDDIEKEGVNTVVIAACSPRMMTDVFDFGPGLIQERVNLREQVVWSQPANHEDTQMMAEDYIRMGIAKAKKMELAEPHIEPIDRTILVVGGGITGMKAALEASWTNHKVVLVEKTERLGGFARKLYKQFPKSGAFDKLQDPEYSSLIQQIEADKNIEVILSSTMENISGQPGLYTAAIKKQSGETLERKIGAIILAAGFRPYEAEKLGRLGYGLSPNVITNVQMEEIASKNNGKILRPSDGKTARNVVFIQCAGSRDPDHLPYCSSVCCMTSLKQAEYVRLSDPHATATILYKDMRTPGQYEHYYKKAQADDGIFLTKGEVVSVGSGQGGNLTVEVDNTLLGRKITVEADLLVLATGMKPATALTMNPEEVAQAVQEAKKAQESGTLGKPFREEDVGKPSILNLNYRRGGELPHLIYGFPDSHYICFPYETQRTGIYAAGTVRAPLDTEACQTDATGAVLKAIQCLELTSQGKAVHPRAGDQTFPEFFLQRCTQCKRCTEECPFGVLDEDEKGTPKPNPYRCRRCGVCMGACPERLISFKDYSVDIISSMIKAVEVPEPDDEKPRVLCFICENDAFPAVDMAGLKRLQYNSSVRFIPLRCLGSTNLVWIADSLSRGMDGIILIGCKHGDDYQCHFIKGSELANYRLEKVQETLDRLHLESDRIQVHQLSINEYDKIPEIVNSMMETIDKVGFNPFKGF